MRSAKTFRFFFKSLIQFLVTLFEKENVSSRRAQFRAQKAKSLLNMLRTNKFSYIGDGALTKNPEKQPLAGIIQKYQFGKKSL